MKIFMTLYLDSIEHDDVPRQDIRHAGVHLCSRLRIYEDTVLARVLRGQRIRHQRERLGYEALVRAVAHERALRVFEKPRGCLAHMYADTAPKSTQVVGRHLRRNSRRCT